MVHCKKNVWVSLHSSDSQTILHMPSYANTRTKKKSIRPVQLFSKKQKCTLRSKSKKGDQQIYLNIKGKQRSFVNDVPLKNPDNTYNMICEIPRYTRRKMEVDWKTVHQPIIQDKNKDGTPRFYQWGDMLFNYGALPQTWEDPDHVSTFTKKPGDDDPLDIIDIGDAQASCGLIYKVKILGILGMIDQNETDWKVVAINILDPRADQINTLKDVKRLKPGVLTRFKEWLRMYKTAEGKAQNSFAFNEAYKSKSFAEKIINETHKAWCAQNRYG